MLEGSSQSTQKKTLDTQVGPLPPYRRAPYTLQVRRLVRVFGLLGRWLGSVGYGLFLLGAQVHRVWVSNLCQVLI